jgi:hypothetical protein
LGLKHYSGYKPVLHFPHVKLVLSSFAYFFKKNSKKQRKREGNPMLMLLYYTGGAEFSLFWPLSKPLFVKAAPLSQIAFLSNTQLINCLMDWNPEFMLIFFT